MTKAERAQAQALTRSGATTPPLPTITLDSLAATPAAGTPASPLPSDGMKPLTWQVISASKCKAKASPGKKHHNFAIRKEEDP